MPNMTQYDIHISLSHLLSGTYIPEGVANMPLTIHPDDQNAMK